MKSSNIVPLALAGILVASPAWAQRVPDGGSPNPEVSATQSRPRNTIRDRDIYGYKLMSKKERGAYRNRMRTATTLEQREQLRAEHHEQMLARAKERGVTLPETPPAGRGPGMHRGGGMGPGAGMGPRDGMGPGRGMGPAQGTGEPGGAGGTK